MAGLPKFDLDRHGRLSRWIPRYFASSDCGIGCEFKVIGGQVSCFNVKVLCKLNKTIILFGSNFGYLRQ